MCVTVDRQMANPIQPEEPQYLWCTAEPNVAVHCKLFCAAFIIKLIVPETLKEHSDRLMRSVCVWAREDFYNSAMILLKDPASINTHFTRISTLIYHLSTPLPVPAAWHLYANRSMALSSLKRLGQFNYTMDTIITYSLVLSTVW